MSPAGSSTIPQRRLQSRLRRTALDHGQSRRQLRRAGVTLGYDFSAGGWDISPSLSAAYRDVDIDGYDETDSAANGGLALRYDDQTIKSKRSILGIALAAARSAELRAC